MECQQQRKQLYYLFVPRFTFKRACVQCFRNTNSNPRKIQIQVQRERLQKSSRQLYCLFVPQVVFQRARCPVFCIREYNRPNINRVQQMHSWAFMFSSCAMAFQIGAVQKVFLFCTLGFLTLVMMMGDGNHTCKRIDKY